MVAAWSPHCDGGGPIHLHSPTRIPHVDATSAIRQLRRSLSRSPSKSSDHRHLLSRSHSPSQSKTPFSPSPLSPRRTASDQTLVHSTHSPSPLATPFPPSARVNRPTMRRAAPPQSNSKNRPSPKSPSKGILAENKNQTNPSQMPSAPHDFDQLMLDPPPFRIDDDKENAAAEGHETMPRILLPKQEKRRSGNFSAMIAASSPLKRSDGIMNLDQASRGSPSAKRRSLHGPSFSTADFGFFDNDLKADEPRRHSEEGEMFALPSAPSSASHLSGIPKRSSSLRKSTLQQRQHERPGQTNSKGRQRMSIDNFLPLSQRDSPFSSQGVLLSASIHPVGTQQGSQSQTIPHPLHQTMTQSSSSSSMADESPTHEPIRRSERPKSMYDFSKSLPIGASRPSQEASFSTDAEDNPSQGSFATPSSYKFAKPLPAAFMSTGLISKKNRNVDEVHGGLPKAHMPDTPCKRTTAVFSFGKVDPPGTSKPLRSIRHSLGSPSTPSNLGESKPRKFPLSFAKKPAIFGSQTKEQPLQRRMSFVSIDREDVSGACSPVGQPDSQSTDSDFPNTPTKLPNRRDSKAPATVRSSFRSQSFSSDDYEDLQRLPSGSNLAPNKLSPLAKSSNCHDEDSDSVMEDSPSATSRPNSYLPAVAEPAASARTQLLRNLKSPTPISRKDHSITPSTTTPAAPRTEMLSLSPSSPLQDKSERVSPQTPQESLLPPDPSRLSISGHSEKAYVTNGSSSASVPPATPTAPREGFSAVDKRAGLALAAGVAPEVDPCLTERFEKAELIGIGEFSLVYRVTQPPEVSPERSLVSVVSARSPPQTSLAEKVWAVKKTKRPYAGRGDRRFKTTELGILRQLGQSDHVILFIDGWEQNNYLYIQTEYCEEGSLDMFLAQVGLKGRLDDFRIWKILLELALGLKHIHDSNVMHLDLKPANVLVSFEGVLKIADFGMATKWPASSDIEREGDREYIGPEILAGHYDKPADIFALGLIMLETAGNVELPDNGTSWQKLRNGDMSDVPSLTWSSENSTIFRDASGDPLPEGGSSDEMSSNDRLADLDSAVSNTMKPHPGARSGELLTPPDFMVNASHHDALDNIVRWMISPDPQQRPVANQILQTAGVQWAGSRRRAGATVFEGNWGPADEVLAEDAEMMDV